MSASWQIIPGDCVDAMRELPDESIDAVVTDPPYGLEFMGKTWDRPWAVNAEARVGFEGREDNLTLPSHRDGRNANCQRCGGRARGAKRCECAMPQWDRPPAQDMRDFQAWCEAWATEARRVLKPGGHLLAFGGTRTYHRLAAGIEDAGFEIRDCLAWLYGSGFPKSLDVAKAIDKAAGAEREVVSVDEAARARRLAPSSRSASPFALNGLIRWGDDYYRYDDLPTEGREWFDAKVNEGGQRTAPATPEAERWEGWGTALKPAFEPVVVARKPLAGTVAGNVLAHGTGALNVDGCRIEAGEDYDVEAGGEPFTTNTAYGSGLGVSNGTHTLGRWPANVVLDPEAAAILDEQTGELPAAGGKPPRRNVGADGRTVYRDSWNGDETFDDAGPLDAGGGPSRFFYCPKSSSAERNAGLDGFSERQAGAIEANKSDAQRRALRDLRLGPDYERPTTMARNVHPTVKPIELMRWLVRLVTPPGGTVLDPFTGSGTTGAAAVLEGLTFVGVEREADYQAIAEARIRFWAEQPAGLTVEQAIAGAQRRAKVADAGQGDLFDALGGEAA